MFAGISTIGNENNGDQLLSMISKENEIVPFVKSFNISSYEKINDWLTEIEN